MLSARLVIYLDTITTIRTRPSHMLIYASATPTHIYYIDHQLWTSHGYIYKISKTKVIV